MVSTIEEIDSILSQSKLKSLYASYKENLIYNIDSKKKTNIPASEFFSEISIGNQLKVSHRMINIASSSLVGLGLFGTFLGLTFGIWGINNSDVGGIQESIDSLIGGTKTAFITSLVGMFFSLIYTHSEKIIKQNFNNSLHILNEKLDQQYYVDDNLLLQYKLSEYIDIQTETISSILERNLSYTDSNTHQHHTITQGIYQLVDQNKQQLDLLSTLSSDITVKFAIA